MTGLTAYIPAASSSPHAGARLRLWLWLAWLVALGLGLVGIYQRMTQGHLPAGYGSY
ncbi:MAG: hypothetical protein AB1601_05465 [Planctomycetota bacterium]